MVDPKAATALVTGVLLVVIGGIGTLVLGAGALLGAFEWTTVGWLLLGLFVGGAGLSTYGVVVLAGDLADAVAGNGLAERVDASRVLELVD